MDSMGIIFGLLMGLAIGSIGCFAILDYQSSRGGWVANDGHTYRITRVDSAADR